MEWKVKSKILWSYLESQSRNAQEGNLETAIEGKIRKP